MSGNFTHEYFHMLQAEHYRHRDYYAKGSEREKARGPRLAHSKVAPNGQSSRIWIRFEPGAYADGRAGRVSVPARTHTVETLRDARLVPAIQRCTTLLGMLATERLADRSGDTHLSSSTSASVRCMRLSAEAFEATFGLTLNEFYEEFATWRAEGFPRERIGPREKRPYASAGGAAMAQVIFARVVLIVLAISLAIGLGVGLARAQTPGATFVFHGDVTDRAAGRDSRGMGRCRGVVVDGVRASVERFNLTINVGSDHEAIASLLGPRDGAPTCQWDYGSSVVLVDDCVRPIFPPRHSDREARHRRHGGPHCRSGALLNRGPLWLEICPIRLRMVALRGLSGRESGA